MDFILTCYRAASASSCSDFYSEQMLHPRVCVAAMGEKGPAWGEGGEREEPDGAGLCGSTPQQ